MLAYFRFILASSPTPQHVTRVSSRTAYLISGYLGNSRWLTAMPTRSRSYVSGNESDNNVEDGENESTVTIKSNMHSGVLIMHMIYRSTIMLYVYALSDFTVPSCSVFKKFFFSNALLPST